MVFKQLHNLDVAEEEFIPFGGMGEDRVSHRVLCMLVAVVCNAIQTLYKQATCLPHSLSPLRHGGRQGSMSTGRVAWRLLLWLLQDRPGLRGTTASCTF